MASSSEREKKSQSRKPRGANGKRSKREAGSGDADLIRALNHELRRDILRLLHVSKHARSPVGIAEQLQAPLASVSYHVQILHRCDVIALTETEQVRGALKHFYASKIKDNPIAKSLLKGTRKSDEAQGRRPA